MSGTAWKAFFVDSQDEVDRVEVDASQIEEQRLTAPGIRSEGSSVDSSTQMHGAGEMDQGEGKESLQMRTGEQVMPRMDLQLGETHQSREDVQQEVFKLHSAYKTYCENPRSGTPFKCCPVFARPPGYKSQFMLQLEAEALKHQPPSFSMKDAVCIVDPKRGAKITRAPYDLVSFAGPKGRKLYPDTEEGVLGLGEDGKQFVARTGGDNVPGKVKPWRFDIVRTKADEREKMASWIYVCVPYRKEAQTKIPRNPPPELDNEMVEFIDKLTAMMVEKAQNKGLLTEGDQQIQRFKKSFTAMLRPLILKFMGQKADPKWADFVFRRNYVQMELGKVFEHIDEYGHLPWVRSEVAVKETGIDLERDHVDLLEAVENLYLYLRNATSLQNHLQVDGDRTLSELPEQRELRRQFLTRIVAYSKMSSKRFCAVSLGSCMLTQCELAVIAKEITQILDGEQTDTENIARLLPKLGESKARQFAAEAARQKSAGETSKTACGVFFQLAKQNWDPLMLLYVQQCKDIHLEQHRPLKPRQYQEEMAIAASSGNTLLVAPTNSGKTKVIGMVLDKMWRENPCAKAIMLAEKIPLVIQQARNLKKWCTPFTSSATLAVNNQGPSIGAYGSFNPCPDLKKKSWEFFFSSHDLFVFTPDTLKNLLKNANLPSLSTITDLNYFVIDEAHHTTKNHVFNELMDTAISKTLKGKSGSIDSQAKQPRILAVTATCGGKMDVDQSIAHLQKLCENVDCKIFSQYDLSEAAQKELSEKTQPPPKIDVEIQTTALETWFEGALKDLATAFRNKSCKLQNSGQDQTGLKVLSDFASTLEEAVKIADDCGVCQAMVWLADEYLSVMCVTRCKEQNSPLLPWIELKFMLSGIFSSLADLQIPEVRESQGILIDNQGYAIDAEPIKQGHLLRQLARIKETTPADIPFRCIVFFRTRHGVKITLERMLAAAKEGKETMCVSESETGHQQEDLKVLRRRLFSGGATEALKPRKFVGKGTRTLSETNSSQEVTRQAFLKGECNLLLATSVAEEGLDFPACNAVILMDGADHDIALKQRIGRVRADEHGSVVVFVRAQSSEQQRYQQAKSKALNADTALKHIVEVKRGGDSGGGDEKKGKVLLPLYKKTEDRGDRSHSKEGVIELKDARCFVASHSEPTSPLPTTPETGGGGGGNVGGISIKLIFQDDKHYRIQVENFAAVTDYIQLKLSTSSACAQYELTCFDSDGIFAFSI